MANCPRCGAAIEGDSNFCLKCGAPLSKPEASGGKPAEAGLVKRIERSVFFRFARGFAWVVAVLCLIYLIFAVVYSIPLGGTLLRGETKVSADEVRAAIESRGGGGEAEAPAKKMDPKQLAKLDEAIYEVIALLPAGMQREQGVESVRHDIRQSIGYAAVTADRISIIQQAKGIIKDFPEDKRPDALAKFFDLKRRKDEAAEEEKVKARAALAASTLTIMLSVMTLTMVTMILVMLTVERNTRRES